MSNEFQQNKDWLKRKTEEEIHGRIVKRGIDSFNRNTPMLKLKFHPYYSEDEEIWKLVSVGDSLSSDNNSPILEIHKNDTILKIDYRQIYKSRDRAMRESYK